VALKQHMITYFSLVNGKANYQGGTGFLYIRIILTFKRGEFVDNRMYIIR
jgi:hypothetical protein